jgi:DNA polymerase-1
MSSSPPPPRVFLIDAHSHLHRAFHAVSGLTTSSGFPTNALFGFLSILNRMVRSYSPGYLAAIFDAPGPSFRVSEYPAYKSQRPPMPEELRVQVAKLKEILTAMGIRQFELPGYEADDLIATLARQAEARQIESWIISVDKDLFQLISPHIRMLRHHLDKEELVDREWVLRKLEVTPEQVPDYLGLVGDSSDNIPGVPGIGPKTAVQLLHQFGTLEALLSRVDEVEKPRWRSLLAEHAEQARLSRRLAILRTDAPVTFELEQLAWTPSTPPRLRELYRELEFRSLIEEAGGVRVEERTVDYGSIRTADELRQFAAEARRLGRFAVDTETTGLDPFDSHLVGISVSLHPHQARYIPIAHDSQAAEGPQLSLESVREILGPVLADPRIGKILQHIQFDYKFFRRSGLRLDGVQLDTMLASYLLNPDKKGHGLKAMALRHLGVEMTHLDMLIGDGSLMTFAQVPVSEAESYACQDADLTLQLADFFTPQLEQAGLMGVITDIEVPLAPVLAEMELAGVTLDRTHFMRLKEETEKQLREIEREAFQLAGHAFNLSSPKQVAKVLFEELHLPSKRRSKTGYSTDVEVLEQIHQETRHPIVRLLLEHRTADKLLNTYIAALPRLLHHQTGRIHTSFNQTATATGRLSSSEPNLQNIPVRTAQGRKIRQGFIPSRPGNMLLAADYSQIELRILAHITGDAGLVEAFRRDADVHRSTAMRIFGCPAGEVTEEMRNQAKTVNFGVIYGISAHGLSLQLGISRTRAQKFIDDYFAAYPGVKRWIDETIASAHRTGEVRTLKGRRRFLADINSPQQNIRSNTERIAVNTPIQGTSADMIKLAMIAIHRRMGREGLKARMILQVHDELIFDAPETELDRLTVLVREEMEKALPLNVPVKVDIKTGRTWAEC